MSLSEIINKVAADAREKREGPREFWYPSDVGFCDRKSVLRHAGVESQPATPETLRKFWMGDRIHDALKYAVEVGLPGAVWHEVPVRNEEFHVSGKIDTLHHLGLDDYEIFEYKSINSRAFEHRLPIPQHILQVSTYLTFPPSCPEHLGEHFCVLCGGKDVLPKPPIRARLIYWSKDDARIEEFVVTTDVVLSEGVKNVFKRLQEQYEEYKQSGKLPPALAKVPVKDRHGKIVRYARSGKWGKVGNPKLMEPFQVLYCDYRGTGLCCGDKNAVQAKAKDVLSVSADRGSPGDERTLPPVRQSGGKEGTPGGADGFATT